MELIKLKENTFGFKGSFTYWQTKHKTIEIDGLEYKNIQRYDVETTVDSYKKDKPYNLCEIDFDFSTINYNIKIEDNNCRSFAKKMPYINYSKNDIVNLIIYAFNSGVLDNRILDIDCGKKDLYKPYRYKEQWNSILKNSSVWITLFGYGFNNTVSYKVSLKTLFDCDYNIIPEDVKSIFIYNGIDLKSKNKLKQVTNLINQKIRKL